jgi:formamidopyrimidine-DNA glycosylase
MHRVNKHRVNKHRVNKHRVNKHRVDTHWVYERAAQPCRRCRTPVTVAAQGAPPFDRLTYWCPACQPA